MPKKEIPVRTYEIVLAARKDNPEQAVRVQGQDMTVNGRGDLLIVHKKSVGDQYYPSVVSNVTCCFRTGSWIFAKEIKEDEVLGRFS